MAISSTGVGSGLDVKSIVSQLVAIEKQPLQQLHSYDLDVQLSAFDAALGITAPADARDLPAPGSGPTP